MKVTLPKIPNARASPLGRTCVASENNPPARKGPTARPAADSVWARPLILPRVAWLGAEFVIWKINVSLYSVYRPWTFYQ